MASGLQTQKRLKTSTTNKAPDQQKARKTQNWEISPANIGRYSNIRLDLAIQTSLNKFGQGL
jgi:hypothetical protein